MPKKLTANEKAAITLSANRASKFLTGKKAPSEDLEKAFSLVEGLKGRTKPPIIGKEAIALWQAKIDYAIANGDSLTLTKLTKAPAKIDSVIKGVISGRPTTTAFWDSNGGCSCGGGGGGTSGW
jgi:hypothetical protein